MHFLWDGLGKGRVLVRSGFLGFLVAAMLAMCGTMTHAARAVDGAVMVAAIAGILWTAGQVASALAKRATHASL